MDLQPKLQILRDHFVIIWILLATVGYIVMTIFGVLNFREYVIFIFMMILAYYLAKDLGLFWLVIMGYLLYLVVVFLVPDVYIDRVRDGVQKNTGAFIQKIETSIRK